MKHTRIHSNFPVAAFPWVFSERNLPEHFDGVISKQQLGPFLEGWYNWYVNTPGGVDSRGARADLASILVMTQEDMAEIEANHAAIRRELYVLSTQTHTQHFLELSSRYMLRCVRRHPASYGTGKHERIGIQRQPNAAASSDAAGPPEKRPKLYASGYRSYLSDVTANDPRGCARPGTGHDYNNLPAAEKQAYEAMASSANEAIKLGSRGFRPNKRIVTGTVNRKSAEERSRALREAAELDPSNTSAAKSLQSMNLCSSTDFDDGIRALKRGLRAAAASDTIVTAIQDDVLADHDRSSRSDGGPFSKIPPHVAEALGAEWKVYPHSFLSNFQHVRGSFPAATKAIGTLAKANGAYDVSKSLSSKLRNLGGELHKPARHDSMAKASREASAKLTSPCNEAGFCVHGAAGRDTRGMKAQLLNVLTLQRFNPGNNKSGRGVLLRSGIVVCAIGCSKPPGVMLAGAVGPQPPDVVECNRWLHIGVMELRPNAFEAHTLELRTPADKLDTTEPCGEITLVGKWEFESTWTFVRDLCKTHFWFLRFFHFSSSARPLGRLEPIQCVVKELEPLRGMSRALRFWNGKDDVDRAARLEHNRIQREFKKAAETGTELTLTMFEPTRT
jgi:hypothetical protein